MNFQLKSLFLAGVVVAGSLFGAARTRAATADLGAFGGWRFGGSFHDDEGDSHTAEPSGSWGGDAGCLFQPGIRVGSPILPARDIRQRRRLLPGPLHPGPLPGRRIERIRRGTLSPLPGRSPGLEPCENGRPVQRPFFRHPRRGSEIFHNLAAGSPGRLRCHLLFGNNYAVSASGGSSGGASVSRGRCSPRANSPGGSSSPSAARERNPTPPAPWTTTTSGTPSRSIDLYLLEGIQGPGSAFFL